MDAQAHPDFLEIKRLGDVVHRAGGQAFHPFLGQCGRGEKQQRNGGGLLIGFQQPAGGQPVASRHGDIHQDHIRLHCLRFVIAIPAILADVKAATVP